MTRKCNLDLTGLLQAAKSGNAEARANLIQAVYEDLRQLAAGKMNSQPPDHTLTSTALVHEVSMRLLGDNQIPGEDRGQFFAYAAKAMRNFLVDHARRRGSRRRGGDCQKFSLDEAMVACEEQRDEFLALHEALERLAEFDTRKARVVEMRYFGGLSNPEVAAALEISEATVKRDWDLARTWLLHRLRREHVPD